MKKTDIKLVIAKEKDCRDIWRWRNHPDVIKGSFNTRPIPWQAHKRWFYSKIKDKNTKIYIARREKEKIGVIRFYTESSQVMVNINLNHEYFGMGFGSKIIAIGSEKFIKSTGENRPIIAEIKKSNIASQKAFAKSGYRRIKSMKDKLVYARMAGGK